MELKEEKEDAIVEVEDGGEEQVLQFSSSKNDAQLLAQLIERQIRIIVEIIITYTFLRFHRLTLRHCIPICVLCSRNLFQ